ncbi:MAG TPA: methyltransferase domain-containing protein [Rhodanobacteraceae bacterium]|nr:methyltransferase domain-containing protein [Rhodanobacteraceae bacterium]
MAVIADDAFAESADRGARMLASWERNASAWTDAVRGRCIASRRNGTDAAILEAVLRHRPASVLDVGCGEGWLARALAAEGCRVAGIDASAALIESARALGGDIVYGACTYAEMGERADALGAPFDLAVCNFSLLDEHLAPTLVAAVRAVRGRGRLVVQTVHPWVACGDAPYADGWRVETFAGFGDGFVAPMPWYFRTLRSWIGALGAAGWRIERIEEPVDRESGKPLSLLITAMAAGSTPA